MRILPLIGLVSLTLPFSSFAIQPDNLLNASLMPVTSSHALSKICIYDEDVQKKRSLELERLRQKDQEERDNFFEKTREELEQLIKHDLKRRKRVGAIFGEGCIKTANDYVAAATIYIHGDTPDHYFQSYFWGQKAYQMGSDDGTFFMTRAIDRYLLSLNKKQLFGTQVQAFSFDGCYCIPPVELSFPDSLREKYKTPTIEQQLKMLSQLNEGKYCPQSECDMALDDSPKGSVAGFW